MASPWSAASNKKFPSVAAPTTASAPRKPSAAGRKFRAMATRDDRAGGGPPSRLRRFRRVAARSWLRPSIGPSGLMRSRGRAACARDETRRRCPVRRLRASSRAGRKRFIARSRLPPPGPAARPRRPEGRCVVTVKFADVGADGAGGARQLLWLLRETAVWRPRSWRRKGDDHEPRRRLVVRRSTPGGSACCSVGVGRAGTGSRPTDLWQDLVHDVGSASRPIGEGEDDLVVEPRRPTGPGTSPVRAWGVDVDVRAGRRASQNPDSGRPLPIRACQMIPSPLTITLAVDAQALDLGSAWRRCPGLRGAGRWGTRGSRRKLAGVGTSG